MKFQTLQSIAILGLAITCLACPSFGTMLSSDSNFPPLAGWYESTSAYSAIFTDGVIVKDVSIKLFTASFPPPAPGDSATHSLAATVSGLASPDGGLTYQPYSGLANMAYRIDSGIDSGATRNFNIELLQMDLLATSPFGPMMIRESPTMPSLGQLSITAMAGGNYSFDSFFDVFTELSVDGGQTWSPSVTPPDHQVLVPEPASLSLLALGALALVRRKTSHRG